MANYIQHSTHHPHFMFISHIFILIKINNDNFISFLNQHIKICILAVQHTYCRPKKNICNVNVKTNKQIVILLFKLIYYFRGKDFLDKKKPMRFLNTLLFSNFESMSVKFSTSGLWKTD